MRQLLILVTIVLYLSSCSTAGVKDIEYVEVEKTMTINKTFDEVWGHVLEWTALKGLHTANTDKNDGIIMLRGSGTISTDFLAMGSEIDQGLVSCGKPTGNIGLYQGKFSDLQLNVTIILREVEIGTRVIVNLTGDVGVAVSNAYGTVSASRNTCASRGVFERKFFEDLRAS